MLLARPGGSAKLETARRARWTESGIDIAFILLIGAGVAVAILYRSGRKRRRRRESLRQDGDGTWVWIGFDGRTHRSHERPDRPGGEWEQERGGSGGGWSSDGWDGGGDGGGGD